MRSSGLNMGSLSGSWRGRFLRGMIAGVVGTVLMTIPILLAKWIGLLQTPPPEAVSDNVAERTWLLPERSNPAFPVAWLAAHTGYGAGCGVAFTLARRFLPDSTRLAGAVFGLAVWIVSYAGYLPVLRLYPSPEDDPRPRQVVMVFAHLIFGVTVAETDDRLSNLEMRRSQTGL